MAPVATQETIKVRSVQGSSQNGEEVSSDPHLSFIYSHLLYVALPQATHGLLLSGGALECTELKVS